MSTLLIQSGTLDDIADAIRAKTGSAASMTPLQMPTQIASIPSGGSGGVSILSGNAPLSNLGSEGDMFLQYPPMGIRCPNGGGYSNIGYSGNDNSEYVIEFKITQAQSSTTPVLFGGKPSSADDTDAVGVMIKQSSSNHIISVLWGGSAIQAFTIASTDFTNKFVRIELKAGLIKMIVNGVEQSFSFTPTTLVNTSDIGVWGNLINGSIDTNSYMRNVWVYKFEISESGVIKHRFMPYKESSSSYKFYDEIDEVYKSINSVGAWDDGGTISNVYYKTNGVWVDAVGSDIEDAPSGTGEVDGVVAVYVDTSPTYTANQLFTYTAPKTGKCSVSYYTVMRQTGATVKVNDGSSINPTYSKNVPSGSLNIGYYFYEFNVVKNDTITVQLNYQGGSNNNHREFIVVTVEDPD